MKKIFLILIAGLIGAFITIGCDDKLIEEPKSILTPGFFTSKQGVLAGLDAAYAQTRRFWGTQDLFILTSIGTDEFSSGTDLAGSGLTLADYSSGYLPDNGQVTAMWREAYIGINTCNGIIDNISKVTTITDAAKSLIIAEAKFLRANYYFILTQFFGEVTVNQNFQTAPSTSAERHPLGDAYSLMISDLNDAIAGLPASPVQGTVQPGRATAAAARHVLAKVYLARGWSIAAQAGDFQSAYTTATDLINSRAALGLDLLTDFDLVHNEGNESNKEVLWTIQHTPTLTHNGSEQQNSSGADNVLNHMWVPQYEQFPGLIRSMEYGRPYIRCVPTLWCTQVAFAERTNDTRYEKTFQVAWIANADKSIPKWTAADVAAGYPGAVVGKPKFAVGDTAIYMPGKEVSEFKRKGSRYLLVPPLGPEVINAGKRTYPNGYTRRLSPAMNKFFDTKRAHFNNPSVRPVIVYRLAETYLIAAEAAFKMGNNIEAANLINAVRSRAARNSAAVTSMTANTLADLNTNGIDYILDERTRELCGENMRWFDLTRTGKLIQRIKSVMPSGIAPNPPIPPLTENYFNPEAAPNILPKHILRPIPLVQIQGVLTGTPYSQNPEWTN